MPRSIYLHVLIILVSILQAQNGGDIFIADSAAYAKIHHNDEFIHLCYNKSMPQYARYFIPGAALQQTIDFSPFSLIKDTDLLNNRLYMVLKQNSAGWNSYLVGRYIALDSLALSPEYIINDDYSNAGSNNPQVKVITDSTLLVIWHGNAGDGYAIYGKIVATNFDYLTPAFKISNSGADGYYIYNGIGAALSQENIFVVWYEQRNDTSYYYCQLMNKTGILVGDPFLIAGPEKFEGFFSCPSVVMPENDNTCIAYAAKTEGLGLKMYLNIYDNNGLLVADAIEISEQYCDKIFLSDMDVDADKLIIVWEARDIIYGGDVIWAQKYSIDTNEKYGNNFMPSQPDGLEKQFAPSLDLSNDTIYIAWSENTPGDNTDSLWLAISDYYMNTNTIFNYGQYVNALKIKCFPNPFNPVTTIQFGLPEDSKIELVVFDLAGRVVRNLVSGKMAAGYQQVDWDGTDDQGLRVASGVYIYLLTAVSLESEKLFTKSGKMVLLK